MVFKIKHANKNVVLLMIESQCITATEIQALILRYTFGDVICRLPPNDSKPL